MVDYPSSQTPGNPMPIQFINDVRLYIRSGKSEQSILEILMSRGLNQDYSLHIIDYVKRSEASLNQNYQNSSGSSGRLRQVYSPRLVLTRPVSAQLQSPQSSKQSQQPQQGYPPNYSHAANSGIQNTRIQSYQNYNQPNNNQNPSMYQRQQMPGQFTNNAYSNVSYARDQSQPVSGHGKKNPLVLIVFLLLIIGIAFGVMMLIPLSQNETSAGQGTVEYTLTVASSKFSAGSSLALDSEIRFSGKSDSLVVTNYLYNSNQDVAFQWVENKQVDGELIESVNKEIPYDITPGTYYVYSEISLPDGSKQTARTEEFTINEIVSETYDDENELANENQYNQDTENTDQNQDDGNVDDGYQISDGEYFDDTNADDDQNQNSDGSTDNANNADQDYDLEHMQEISEDEKLQSEENEKKFTLAVSYVKGPNPDNAKAASVCLEFTENVMRDTCMTQLATGSGNYAFCNEIQDLYNKDYCYLNYVINSKDYEKCEYIVAQDSKNSCDALKQSGI